MDWPPKFCISAAVLIVVASAISGVRGDVMVSGTVFCDQCRDGQISLFDYPLNGANVTMACLNSNGEMTALGEQTTTDWMGGYAMRFQGTPDLRACSVQVSSGGQGSRGCSATPGPPKSLKLTFSMFEMEMYTVDPLISQPAEPMSFCSGSSNTPVTPPAKTPPSASPVTAKPPSASPVTAKPPPASTPRLPHLPPMPTVPFLAASACPYQKWTTPEYRCYWKVVRPETTVGVAFGLIAARKYGTDMTLEKAMQGKAEAYRTLLREGTTALLNSYYSIQFPFHPLGVVENMNSALTGTKEQALHTALRFMRANSGNGRVPCKFTPCK